VKSGKQTLQAKQETINRVELQFSEKEYSRKDAKQELSSRNASRLKHS
jgi:hypothetical protein